MELGDGTAPTAAEMDAAEVESVDEGVGDGEGEGNETPTEDAIVWPHPPANMNGSMPTLHSPAPRRAGGGAEDGPGGRQLHSADGGGAGPSGSGGGGSGSHARGLYPHPYPHDGAGRQRGTGSSNTSPSRQHHHRPRSVPRNTQQQPQHRSSPPRSSPEIVAQADSSNRGAGRRFWGSSTPRGAPPSSSTNAEPAMVNGTAASVRPPGPGRTRLNNGPSTSSAGPSRDGPPRGATSVMTHGPTRHHRAPPPHHNNNQNPNPNHDPNPNRPAQSYIALSETPSQYVHANNSLPPSTRLQELIAGLHSSGPPRPIQTVETPSGDREIGAARRAAGAAAMARMEAFRSRMENGEDLDGSPYPSSASASPQAGDHVNGNDGGDGWDNDHDTNTGASTTDGYMVEMDEVLSDAFRSSASPSSGPGLGSSSGSRNPHPAVNNNGRGRTSREASDAHGNQTTPEDVNPGNNSNARRTGGGLHQFTSLFNLKRSPEH